MDVRLAHLALCSAGALALTLAGCGKSDSATSGSSASPSKSASQATAPAWLLAAMPEGAVDVAAAKQAAKEGDSVVVRGRIGGRVDPISKENAVFVIVDPVLLSCDQIEGDTCSTPWDYCCETPESMAAHNATVQIVDASGTPFAIDVQTVGLKPLDTIVIVGTVGPRPSPQVLTIRATGVHRVGG